MRELEAKKMPRRERFSDSALSSGSPDFQTRTPNSAPEVRYEMAIPIRWMGGPEFCVGSKK